MPPVVAVRHVPLVNDSALLDQEAFDRIIFYEFIDSLGILSDRSRYANDVLYAYDDEFYRAFYARRLFFSTASASLLVPPPLGLWIYLKPVQEPPRPVPRPRRLSFAQRLRAARAGTLL